MEKLRVSDCVVRSSGPIELDLTLLYYVSGLCVASANPPCNIHRVADSVQLWDR